MPQRQIRLVVSNPSSNATKLSEVKCRMLSVGLPSLPKDLAQKIAELRHERPGAAVVIERLVDDLLSEVS